MNLQSDHAHFPNCNSLGGKNTKSAKHDDEMAVRVRVLMWDVVVSKGELQQLLRANITTVELVSDRWAKLSSIKANLCVIQANRSAI